VEAEGFVLPFGEGERELGIGGSKRWFQAAD